MNDVFDDFTDLLGAFALDAVDGDEHEEIERHLHECPRCRAEVAEHREVAAMLAVAGGSAPDGVWDRIVAELSPPAPPLRLSVAAPGDPSVGEDLPPDLRALDIPGALPAADPGDRGAAPTTVTSLAERRRPAGRIALAVGAVAACIVAVLGFVAVRQTQRVDELNTALGDQSVETLADDVIADAAVFATLEGDAGRAQAVVAESGDGYLIARDMPAPAEGDVYQLWGKVDGTVLSLGTFSGANEVVPFSVDPTRLEDIELFAVTEERAPGVVSSSNPALMAGEV